MPSILTSSCLRAIILNASLTLLGQSLSLAGSAGMSLSSRPPQFLPANPDEQNGSQPAIPIPSGSASPQVPIARKLQGILNHEYKGKILVLRNFYTGNHLRYDSDGKLVKRGNRGTWTLDGNIAIASIKLDRHSVEVKGLRLFLAWDTNTKHFRALPTYPVEIRIDLAPNLQLPLAAERLFKLVFLQANENTMSVIPSYWKSVMEGREPSRNEMTRVGAIQGKNVYAHIAGTSNATPPKALSDPDPPYSSEARYARVRGEVELRIIIDQAGGVYDVLETSQPLGYRLDQEAIETVRGWKFKPAEVYGIPSPVFVTVKIKFHLY